jgi:hypothetical protein
MSREKLNDLTVTQLTEKFLALALAQDKAEFNDEIGKYNRLYREMQLVKTELKARTGDQRRALLPLLGHPNAQVRFMASVATLAVDLQSARRALQVISDRDEYPQAADARGMMKALDDGTYVPT